MDGAGTRTAAERAGVDRKTARRYVEAAQAAGLDRSAGFDAVDDALLGVVVAAVRPARPNGHGQPWEMLLTREQQITEWVAGEGVDRPLTIVKIGELLDRQGCKVPYRTLHRFATERCGYRPKETTVPVVDGEPGVECQVDFGRMGWLVDPDTERRRRVHALIFTAVVSRHMFVWLSYAQTLAAVIAGCEAAWAFFGGVFKVLIPDNLRPVVTEADAVNPRLSTGWLDYAQHAGFVTDTARIRRPRDKARVERCVQFVRNSFWAGESFTDLPEAQARAEQWCLSRAGMRIHGTLQARPLEVFRDREAGVLLPVPGRYDLPTFTRVKVHRDFHVEVGKALYSVPTAFLGHYLDARADSQLVKLSSNGRLVKVHPRQLPGRRSTDPADLPAERTSYALRDLTRLVGVCAGHGTNIGIYAERILDDPLPWTRMRAVYRLLGMVRRYGAGPVEAACSTALDLDVISVAKIEAMLAKATEATAPTLPSDPPAAGARFARDPAEYALDPASHRTGTANDGTGTASEGTGTASAGTTRLTLVDGSDEQVSA
ncbi:MAG TPA: IS21 family transposase [Actinomycetota bacterium]|nr:IS21 family transposase [Actinomycetota bacterium]